MKEKRLNRRDFLKGVTLAAGAAIIAACTSNTNNSGSGGSGSSGTQPTGAVPVSGQPTATGAAGAGASNSGASGSAAAAPPPAQLPRGQTLYVNGFQFGPPTTFNPLNNNPTWPAQGLFEHLYETLFAYNQLTGKLDPMLAKSVSFSSDNLTATITMQDGTKWQDGQPLTVDDVLYSYNLAKTQTDLNYSTLFTYITDIKSTGTNTLQVSLNKDKLNPGLVQNFLSSIFILPKHIWSGRESKGKLSQVVDMAPVGSGPYKVLGADQTRIALQRDDNYWGKTAFGGLPAPKYIVHPIFKSNDDGNLAFQRGEVDFSQQFVPQIWQMWQNKKLAVGTWYNKEPYYVPGSIPIMIINTQKKGLDNPKVRLALAYVIDYPTIAATAMSRYSTPANASLIIPNGGEKQYFNADQVKANGWSYDPAKAKQILEGDLKAKKGGDGVYVLPDGTRLGPWTVRTPYGWTDWMTACSSVSQTASANGFDIKTEFPEAPVVTTKIQNGDFDLNLWYISGMSPATPWQRFRDMLDNRGVPANGQAAFWDYNRFNSPDAPALLDQAAATTDPTKLKDLYSKLDKIFTDNIPGIPLMYRPLQFYEFNQIVWTGFPTSDNPSAPPMHYAAGIEVLYKIKSKQA